MSETEAVNSNRWARAIGLWAFALVVGAVGMYLIRQGPPRTATVQPDVPPKKEPATTAPAEAMKPVTYTPPPGLSEGMQAFDKALLFLIAKQEPDGHWSAKKSGAADDFCNENGDIVLTSLGAYALMSTLNTPAETPKHVDGSKRALQWLKRKIREDGGLADEKGPGEVVLAQIWGSIALRAATENSHRDEWEQLSGKAVRHCMKMMSKDGGFGHRPGDEHARMDLTALGAFIYAMSFQSGVRFGTTDKEQETLDAEAKIEKQIEAAMNKMRLNPEKRDGICRMSTAGGDADFDATLIALLGQQLENRPPGEYGLGFEFLFGKKDENTGYPGPGDNFGWGKAGEGYRALPVWLGTWAISFYGETTSEYKIWREAFQSAVLKNQSPDGSWVAAGDDARYGRVWRTAFTAFSLALLNPKPPAPAPQGGAPVAAPTPAPDQTLVVPLPEK